MIEDDFERGFARHLRDLGFVPPEFREKQRFADKDEPPNYLWRTTPARMRSLLNGVEQQAIDDAAILAHRRAPEGAEAARERGGYGKLGVEKFIIPDQRPLLQGGDHNPLD